MAAPIKSKQAPPLTQASKGVQPKGLCCTCQGFCRRRHTDSDDENQDHRTNCKQAVPSKACGKKTKAKPGTKQGAKVLTGGSRDNSMTSGVAQGHSHISDTTRHSSDVTTNNNANESKKSSSRGYCLCCRRQKSPSMDTQMAEGEKVTGKQKCWDCCRKFTAFLFSHVGLSSLVVAYAVLGAFIFTELEAPHEKNERIRMTEVRKMSLMRLWNVTNTLNVLYEQNWTAEAELILEEFQMKMYHAVKWDGWDGKDAHLEPNWSFFGALLYSITVITTIGYGHITPKTVFGRLATIGYALVGIPLTLLCLANLGTLLGDCFRFLYKHLCYGLMWIFCPSHYSSKRGCRRRQRMRRKSRSPSTKSRSGNGIGSGRADMRKAEEGEVTYIIDDTDVEDEREVQPLQDKKVRVPMVVSLLIITLYIIFGALLFSIWEQEWDILIGAYFCFITLSTIGFGDFVPGFGTGWSKEKAVFNAIYLVFGLALIAMCFNLMQEEVRAKCAWLARKINLIDKTKSPSIPVSLSSKQREDKYVTLKGAPAVTEKHQRESIHGSNKRNVFPREHMVFHVDTDEYFKQDTGNGTGISKSVLARDGVGSNGAAVKSGIRTNSTSGQSRIVNLSTAGSMPSVKDGSQVEESKPIQPRGITIIPAQTSSRPSTTSRVLPPQKTTKRSQQKDSQHEKGYETEPLAAPATSQQAMSVSTHDIQDGGPSLERIYLKANDSSLPASPKMTRRDRSRSPVRGRSRTRGNMSESSAAAGDGTRTSAGIADVDDDTVDASSTASSTDLIKVANALRRERRPQSLSPAASPVSVRSEDTLLAQGDTDMLTFRPTVPPAYITACTLIPTTSRPPSRCQSRARSTSPVLRSFYQQGFDVLAAVSKTAGTPVSGVEENGEVSDANGSAEQWARSAFSKPRQISPGANRMPQQQSQPNLTKRSKMDDSKTLPRCVSPMPKAMRSPSPHRIESPTSMSSSTSTEFQRPPPKVKNRSSRLAVGKPS